MKLALLSESPADEAALEVWVEALVGHKCERVRPSLRARGWPNVAQVMPAILRHLHFHTEARALVVVVDSDDSVVHDDTHERPGYYHPGCRLCRLRAIFRQTTKNLPPAHGRERLWRAIGLAVPAMEAWYLNGRDEGVTEAAWVAGQSGRRRPYSRAELKQRVFRTTRPTLPQATARAREEALRQAGDLRRLEYDFPGFAFLAADVRAWPLGEVG